MAHIPGHINPQGTNTNIGNSGGTGPAPMGGVFTNPYNSTTGSYDPAAIQAAYAQNMPMQQTSWMGMIGAAAPAVAAGIVSGIQLRDASKKAKDQEILVDNLMSQYMSKPIRNPYANMPVATKAAEMKAEEADQALANTLDNFREAGYGAGGATALARAAVKSKQGITASIEQQEARNAQLAAKGEMMVQQAEFSRLDQQMDYEQSKADLANQQKVQAMEGLAGAAGSLGSLALQAGTYNTTAGEAAEEGRRFFANS